jgi:integrase
VHTGLRLGDVARLTGEDIKDGIATVMPEKTARSKKVITIPLSQPCLDWIADREGPLFPTIPRQQKGTTSAQFTAIMNKSGVPKRVRLAGGIEATRSFHSLRHTFTSWLADAGSSRKCLNHENESDPCLCCRRLEYSRRGRT